MLSPSLEPEPSTILNPSLNINFNPLPSTSQKCPKLKIQLILAGRQFMAGEAIYGKMEVECFSKTEIMLGEISVALLGYEEINHKIHQSRTFLTKRVVFQGARHPPSEAVNGPCINGYYLARKAKTLFNFRFDIPEDSPASFQHSMASLTYNITGLVKYKFNGKDQTFFTRQNAQIIDIWDPKFIPMILEPVERTESGKLLFGGDGLVTLSASIRQKLIISGSHIPITIRIRNESRKKLNGIKITFVKHVIMLRADAELEDVEEFKIIKESVSSVSFKDADHKFEPDEERELKLIVSSPPDAVTIHNTFLTEVQWRIMVSLIVPGILGKIVNVELPVYIGSPLSIQHNTASPKKKEELATTDITEEFCEPSLPNLAVSEAGQLIMKSITQDTIKLANETDLSEKTALPMSSDELDWQLEGKVIQKQTETVSKQISSSTVPTPPTRDSSLLKKTKKSNKNRNLSAATVVSRASFDEVAARASKTQKEDEINISKRTSLDFLYQTAQDIINFSNQTISISSPSPSNDLKHNPTTLDKPKKNKRRKPKPLPLPFVEKISIVDDDDEKTLTIRKNRVFGSFEDLFWNSN